MTLKPVGGAGWLKDLNDNFADLAPVDSVNGLGSLRVARFTFDTAGLDAAGVANTTVAAHSTGVTIPIHGIVVGGFIDVNTAFDSAGGGATLAIHVQAANDVITATDVDVTGGVFASIGRKAITPKANTPESTSLKASAARAITCTVAVEALTAGKLTGYLYFVEGIASA